MALVTVSSARWRRSSTTEVFQGAPRDPHTLLDGLLPERFETLLLGGETATGVRGRGAGASRPGGATKGVSAGRAGVEVEAEAVPAGVEHHAESGASSGTPPSRCSAW